MKIEDTLLAIQALIGATLTPGGDSDEDDVLDQISSLINTRLDELRAAGVI